MSEQPEEPQTSQDGVADPSQDQPPGRRDDRAGPPDPPDPDPPSAEEDDGTGSAVGAG